MQNFAYANPSSVKEAVGLLGSDWNDAAVLAGGTDLITLMKEHLATPRLVVNVKNIKELGGISETRGTVRIGATVTLDDLTENAIVRKNFPALYQAARGVASPQIRNMGTLAGDLCQRPRCWYFRHGFGLLATADGKPLPPDGENRYHAILGNQGPAYFVSASSLGPPLIALGATLHLVSAKGSRDLPVEQFFVNPRDEHAREIAIRPDELITEINIPLKPTLSATYEVRQKEALDWPLATASVVIAHSGNAVTSARVVLGHVAPTPWSAKAADGFLAGKTITPEVAAEAAKQALMGASPLSQNTYKIQLAQVALRRALLAAAAKV